MVGLIIFLILVCVVVLAAILSYLSVILIQDKIKKGPIPPQMRALTTIIFLLVVLGVVGVTIYRHYQAKKGISRKERRVKCA